MTYVLSWFLCAICSYLLGKSYIENLFRPFGGLPSVCRKIWLEDLENSYEEKLALEDVPDGFIAAILWTLLLIACMIIWPIVIIWLVYNMIVKPDMTEFEEMFK